MDRDLIEQARRGDREAFTDLLRSRIDRLYAVSQRILRDVDRAEDALQDALVIAWRDLRGLRDPDRFDAWVHRLVVRSCIAAAVRDRRVAANLFLLPPELAAQNDAFLGVADRDQLERGFRRLDPVQRALLVQRVELRQPGLLDVATAPGSGACESAPDATYAWQRSPLGARLSLSAITDGCTERAALVAGEYVRNARPNSDQACAGPLDAGSYFSTEFAPRTGETTIVGGLRYTVPAGWENDGERAPHYSLRPDASAQYALAHPGSLPASIFVLARPYAAAQTADCSDPRDPAVGHSIPDLVTWLEGHPGLTAGTPEDIVIGDLPGVAIDIDIDPAWTTTCTGYPSPVVAVFRSGPSGWESTIELGGVGTERDPARVILLQVTEDAVAAVLVYPGATSTLDAFVAEAMPIVETFRFP